MKPQYKPKEHFKKSAIPVSVRFSLAERHGCAPGETIQANCHYCGEVGVIKWFVQPSDRGRGWVSFVGLEMDHVVPEFLGGPTTADNIVLACQKCNRSKSFKSIEAWKGNLHA